MLVAQLHPFLAKQCQANTNTKQFKESKVSYCIDAMANKRRASHQFTRSYYIYTCKGLLQDIIADRGGRHTAGCYQLSATDG